MFEAQKGGNDFNLLPFVDGGKVSSIVVVVDNQNIEEIFFGVVTPERGMASIGG